MALQAVQQGTQEALAVGPSGAVTVGRSPQLPSSHRVSSDPRVSKHHCTFVATADSLAVIDCSTNGTFVNGARIPRGRPQRLAAGDVVTLCAAAAPGLALSAFPAFFIRPTSGTSSALDIPPSCGAAARSGSPAATEFPATLPVLEEPGTPPLGTAALGAPDSGALAAAPTPNPGTPSEAERGPSPERLAGSSAHPFGVGAPPTFAPGSAPALAPSPASIGEAPEEPLQGRADAPAHPDVIPPDSSSPVAVWYFQEDLTRSESDTEGWAPYPQECSARIEAAYQAKKEVEHLNQTYSVHFGDLRQFQTRDKMRQRPIKRVLQEAPTVPWRTGVVTREVPAAPPPAPGVPVAAAVDVTESHSAAEPDLDVRYEQAKRPRVQP